MWFQFFQYGEPEPEPAPAHLKTGGCDCYFTVLLEIQVSTLCFKHTTRSLTQGRSKLCAHLVFNHATVLHCSVSDFICDDSTRRTDKHCGVNWLERLLAAPAGKGGKGHRRGHFCLEV